MTQARPHAATAWSRSVLILRHLAGTADSCRTAFLISFATCGVIVVAILKETVS
jgi:hypothetical protein